MGNVNRLSTSMWISYNLVEKKKMWKSAVEYPHLLHQYFNIFQEQNIQRISFPQICGNVNNLHNKPIGKINYFLN